MTPWCCALYLYLLLIIFGGVLADLANKKRVVVAPE